jgi:hypothetical protein
MNAVKRILGILWIIAGPAAVFFMVSQALHKIGQSQQAILQATSQEARLLAESAKLNVQLQWGIIVLIFVPIAFGLLVFGYYALSGEYDKLPHASVDL